MTNYFLVTATWGYLFLYAPSVTASLYQKGYTPTVLGSLCGLVLGVAAATACWLSVGKPELAVQPIAFMGPAIAIILSR